MDEKIIQQIKDRSENYEMFEQIIIEGLARRPEVADATPEQIRKGIDAYLLDLYREYGIRWVDAWDEKHREIAAFFIEEEMS